MWPTLQAIDKTILVACGCGLCASVVAISQIPTWPIVMDEDHSSEPDFIKTKAAFILGLIASAASLAIGIVRMKVEASMHSKTVRLLFVSSLLASFLCLLVAVAVWGDFIKHGERNSLHRSELRWSYWVAVVADVFQFLGFLLYIIRSDFKSAPSLSTATTTANAGNNFKSSSSFSSDSDGGGPSLGLGVGATAALAAASAAAASAGAGTAGRVFV